LTFDPLGLMLSGRRLRHLCHLRAFLSRKARSTCSFSRFSQAHGYAIAQRLEQVSKAVVQINQGSLYPALHRLEQKGWLTAEWKPSETGREAKFYCLTPSGRKQLKAEKESWARLTGAVQLVFDEGN